MNLKLLVVQGRPRGKCLHFPPGEYVFGRGLECHIRPNSPWVSRQHCLLRNTAEGAFIRDLGSSNGTLLNGKSISAETILHPGDRLQIGPLVLEVTPGEGDTAHGNGSSAEDSWTPRPLLPT
jgi:pSer/pThr/pTyr-binding forkhead associated (FHA) protein